MEFKKLFLDYVRDLTIDSGKGGPVVSEAEAQDVSKGSKIEAKAQSQKQAVVKSEKGKNDLETL